MFADTIGRFRMSRSVNLALRSIVAGSRLGYDAELRGEQEIVERRATYQVEQRHEVLCRRLRSWIWPA
jgi:hypothetical protein